MDRRRFLLAGSAVMLAGCSGAGESTDPGTPPADTTASQATTDTVEIGGVSSDQLHRRYLSSSLREFRIVSWTAVESVRVYDADADGVAQVEPEEDLFVQVELSEYNAGGDPLEPVAMDGVTFHNGQVAPTISTLPSDEYTFADLRENPPNAIRPPIQRAPDVAVLPDEFRFHSPLFDVAGELDDWAVNITPLLEASPQTDQFLIYQ